MRVDAMIRALQKFPKGAVVIQANSPQVYAPIDGKEDSVGGWERFEMDQAEFDLPYDWKERPSGSEPRLEPGMKDFSKLKLIKFIRDESLRSLQLRVNNMFPEPRTPAEEVAASKMFEGERLPLKSAKDIAEALMAQYDIKEKA